MRVQAFAHGLDALDTVAGKDALQVLLGHLDAVQKRLELFVALPGIRGHAAQGPAQIVGDADDVLDQRYGRELDRIVALARGTAANVLDFRQRPEQLVLQHRDLALEADNRILYRRFAGINLGGIKFCLRRVAVGFGIGIGGVCMFVALAVHTNGTFLIIRLIAQSPWPYNRPWG